MEVLIPLIQKSSISRATNTVKNMIKIAEKSLTGWNTVPEYLSDDLTSDSEDDKTLKAAEARALRKQKIKVKNNSVSSFGKSTHAMTHRTIPNVSVPRLFIPSSTTTKPISSISSTITRDTSNKNTKNSSNSHGFVSNVENWVTTETNVDLTKEHKDKDITDKYNFLFSKGSVNCKQFVEFEEFDGCL